MLVKVVQLFEDGRPLPRHRAVRAQPVHLGQLTFVEEYDRDVKRTIQKASLKRLGDGANVLPPMRDAVVRWIGDGSLTISGLEIDDLTRVLTAQSSLAQVDTDAH